jgi:hypothetical protein
LAQPVKGFDLFMAAHPALGSSTATLSAYGWEDGAQAGRTQFDLPANMGWLNVSLPLPLRTGQYRLILQVSDQHIESGLDPRRIGLGLGSLRSC